MSAAAVTGAAAQAPAGAPAQCGPHQSHRRPPLTWRRHDADPSPRGRTAVPCRPASSVRRPLRQANRCCGEMSCRRATSDTTRPAHRIPLRSVPWPRRSNALPRECSTIEPRGRGGQVEVNPPWPCGEASARRPALARRARSAKAPWTRTTFLTDSAIESKFG